MSSTAVKLAAVALCVTAAAAAAELLGGGFVICRASCTKTAVIGSATIDGEGTITLNLSRPASGLLTNRRGDSGYDLVLRHIGPISPGEFKPVFEFPPIQSPPRGVAD